MSQMRTDFDVLIVGGGMVGASLAIALSEHQLRIGLLEAAIPSDPGRPSYDDRGIALAHGSQKNLSGDGFVGSHPRRCNADKRYPYFRSRSFWL